MTVEPEQTSSIRTRVSVVTTESDERARVLCGTYFQECEKLLYVGALQHHSNHTLRVFIEFTGCVHEISSVYFYT